MMVVHREVYLMHLRQFSQEVSIEIRCLEEINMFLDETYGKQIDINDFFSDVDKFVHSVTFYQKTVGINELCEKKRFRLKKLLTTIRKSKAMSKRKK